jgi:dTDP-4-amino-4,6-dideoxygalactose transaminase
MAVKADPRGPSSRPRVPFLDLKGVNDRDAQEMRAAIDRVLESGRYLQGGENQAFAAEFATWNGSSHCVPLANGLDALRLALRGWLALGRLVAGDEVVVPANSFVASALAVSESGLAPVFADVDPATFNVTLATVVSALTDRTRAVMPVHLFGQVADIVAIQDLCRLRGLLLLEDAAQAHGASIGGVRAGAFGDAGAFSFYPSKNLGALGDAGALVTDDPQLAHVVRALGNYGSTRKYHHDHLGTNSRLDEVQAAILRVKLERLDADNARRRAIAGRYSTEIAHPLVHTPALPAEAAAHVWHLYVVTTPHRSELTAHLDGQGIETLVHYPCVIHQQPAYADLFGPVRLPVAERLQREVLSLPMSPVMTDDEVGRVIAAVNAWPGTAQRTSETSQ